MDTQGPNGHTVATRHKNVLTPTATPVVRVGGRGEGVQIEKIHWVIILSPKMMITRGVGHPISPAGECYANDPKIGWYGARTRI